MTNKITEVFESENSNYTSTEVERALKLAEKAANRAITTLEYFKTIGIHSDSIDPTIRAEKKALAAIREVLAEQSMAMILNDPHPPHRLCECTACLEYWTPLPDCDAFSIRAEALEEAAKVCEDCSETLHQWTDKRKVFAAAIRGLK